MDQREEHTNTIHVRSDDGRRFDIYEYTTFFTTYCQIGMDFGKLETQGSVRLELADGSTVRQVGNGKYEVVNLFGEDITVREEAPDAT